MVEEIFSLKVEVNELKEKLNNNSMLSSMENKLDIKPII